MSRMVTTKTNSTQAQVAVVTAVNDEQVLKNNLLNSPMIREGSIPVVIERGHDCADVS